MTPELSQIRAKFLKARKILGQAVFGESQEFAIRIFTNTLLNQTQVEPFGNPVTVFLAFGTPGSGKTVLARVIASLIDSGCSMIQGLGDMMPSALVGFIEFTGDGGERYRQAAIRLGAHVILLDEFNRANPENFNPIGHIAAEGTIPVVGSSNLVEIVPKDELLIMILTANPDTSGGTKPSSDFIMDRVIGSGVFRTHWEDPEYIGKLLNLGRHWRGIEESGILKEALFNPGELLTAQKVFEKETGFPPAVENYLIACVQKIALLFEERWASELKSLPPRVREYCAKNNYSVPDDSLVHEPGGRFLPHWSGLVRADSFLTAGQLEATIDSVQQMLPAVIAHRLMFRLGTGGSELLRDVYQNKVIQFAKDVLPWVASLVPRP